MALKTSKYQIHFLRRKKKKRWEKCIIHVLISRNNIYLSRVVNLSSCQIFRAYAGKKSYHIDNTEYDARALRNASQQIRMVTEHWHEDDRRWESRGQRRAFGTAVVGNHGGTRYYGPVRRGKGRRRGFRTRDRVRGTRGGDRRVPAPAI